MRLGQPIEGNRGVVWPLGRGQLGQPSHPLLLGIGGEYYTRSIRRLTGGGALELYGTISASAEDWNFFDNTTIHRIAKNFVVQAGDPTGTGRGGPGYQTEEDKNELKNLRGYVSMAKAGAVTQVTSQFFINVKDNPVLDSDAPNQKRFFPFAQVISGMDVVDAINNVPLAGGVLDGKPATPINIISVTVTESPK